MLFFFLKWFKGSSLLTGPHRNLRALGLPNLWLSLSTLLLQQYWMHHSFPNIQAQCLCTSCSLYLELLSLILSASQTPTVLFKTPTCLRQLCLGLFFVSLIPSTIFNLIYALNWTPNISTQQGKERNNVYSYLLDFSVFASKHVEQDKR